MMTFDYDLEFYPVGQGLFAAGEIACDTEDPFTFVYDCGTSGTQSLIKNAIDTYHKKPIKDIDLLIISHFDKDHISGLDELLSKKPPKNILMPYLTLAERLFLLLSQESENTNEEIRFFIDPIKYITEKNPDQIQNIYLMPPSILESEGDIFEPDTDERLYVDVNNESQPNLIGNTNVFQLRNKGRLIFRKIFEFIPYNDAKHAEKIDSNFKTAVEAERSVLLTSQDKQEIKAVVKKIKEIYNKNCGKSAINRNIISLFLYAAPISNLPRDVIFTHTHQKNTDCFCKCFCESAQKNGLFFCGDGMLDTVTRTDDLIRFYGQIRIENIASFQVMHHGAKTSWHQGISSKFKPLFSIFSADPNHKGLNHPNAEVVKDFLPFNPILVDTTQGFKLYMRTWI
jgi:hypothetical protein